MGFDRKNGPPSFLLSIPRLIQHITLHLYPVEGGARLGGAGSALTKRSWSPVEIGSTETLVRLIKLKMCDLALKRHPGLDQALRLHVLGAICCFAQRGSPSTRSIISNCRCRYFAVTPLR
jgi:hypothetical protein